MGWLEWSLNAEASPARAAVLRCRAAEMGLQALAALTQEGLLPTAALVLDRICAYARRQRMWLLGHDCAKEGLGLLLQRGWLKEESSLFYTCLRCSEVLLRDVMKGLSPRSLAPKAADILNLLGMLCSSSPVPFLGPLLSALSSSTSIITVIIIIIIIIISIIIIIISIIIIIVISASTVITIIVIITTGSATSTVAAAAPAA
ncbi:hypothetical protein AK812_SmicGene37818, partial [Symbiodinium microadriaticum]